MPNQKGGKGYKKAKKTSFQTPAFETAKDGQLYARVLKRLGDKRFSLVIHDTTKPVLGRARGALKGWHTIRSDDIVLISGRDFRNNEDEKEVEQSYDIIGFYTNDQVRKLIKSGEITDSSFTESSRKNESSDIFFNDVEDDDEEVVEQQRNYDLPSSESEDEDSDVDVDNL